MSSFFPDKAEDFRDTVEQSLIEAHQKLNLILKYLNIFYEKDNKMSYDLSSLLTAVQNEKTVEQSLMSLVQGLSQRVASLAAQVMDDTTKQTLADLANELNANAAAMSAAVTAGTPATPVVPNTPASPADAGIVAPNVAAPATPTVSTDTTTVNPPAADATNGAAPAPAPAADTGATGATGPANS